MNVLRIIYRFINNTSLDVAAGAVIGALFFAKVMQAVLFPQAIAALGLSVWIIYTADHLLDARKTKIASTERHRFHQRNFFPLFIILVVASMVNLVLIFYLREPIFKAGLMLGCMVTLYLFIHQRLRFLKEVAGAFFYTAGIVLPSLSLIHFTVDTFSLLLIIQFMLTALINLLLFSWFDRMHDEKDKHTSFTTVMGEHFTKILIGAIFFICLVIVILQLSVLFNWPTVVVTLMDLALLIIIIFDNFFSINDRYRFLGDAVFLFPLLYLLAL